MHLLLTLGSFCFCLSPDKAFEAWCKKNDIYSSRISCRTTGASIGGRGLFTDHDVREGEVLATIPARLLLTSNDKALWAGEIAAKAKVAEPVIAEWVSTWSGGFSEDLEAMGALGEGARRQVGVKLEKRRKQFEGAKVLYGLERDDWAMYNMIWSRACYLGPQWKNEIGIIPFFDMLNHTPKENVRLSSLGDAMRGFEGALKPADLDEKDMLIIAKEDIAKDSELLTCYLNEGKADSKEDRDELAARRMVVWGF
ncbi:hypothetical protein TrVE_jg13105 [Triparma verrucosa]|uniref:SET domain-containing protein n=1 Tax=Triparma verrucosa TaxID=1606542 RepID=A0A9W7BFH6_9STRA|nr:hypothetical protein TrVE_jg13105 [Triparma verrucosa]